MHWKITCWAFAYLLHRPGAILGKPNTSHRSVLDSTAFSGCICSTVFTNWVILDARLRSLALGAIVEETKVLNTWCYVVVCTRRSGQRPSCALRRGWRQTGRAQTARAHSRKPQRRVAAEMLSTFEFYRGWNNCLQ